MSSLYATVWYVYAAIKVSKVICKKKLNFLALSFFSHMIKMYFNLKHDILITVKTVKLDFCCCKNVNRSKENKLVIFAINRKALN